MMAIDNERVFAAVADERRHIADLIDSLDNAQLATPSLCAGWDVKTVAAHLVSVFDDSFWVFMGTAARRRSMSGAIDELARRRARLPAAEIADTLRRRAEHRLSPPLFGPTDPLADILVHGGDMRIPLGLPFHPQAELAAPGVPAEVAGPAAAPMMAVCGRPALLDALHGPGLPLLRKRLLR